MKYLYIICILYPYCLFGQDWFDDSRGEGNPIIVTTDKGPLVSARVNSTDNSIKVNFFNWTGYVRNGITSGTSSAWTSGRTVVAPAVFNDNFKKIGWGLGLKAKAEDGIASIFSGGASTPGVQANGYIAFFKSLHDDVLATDAAGNPVTLSRNQYRYWLISAGYTRNEYRFYRPFLPSNEQLTSLMPFDGAQASISYLFMKPYSDGRQLSNQFFFGVSLTYRSKNNYGSLPKTEIKSTNTTTIGLVTTIDKNGSTYALETEDKKFKILNEWTLRGQIGINPGKARRVALMTYPELRYSLDKLIFDLSLGIHFLDKDDPLISPIGIFFKLNDIGNNDTASDPFFKRSFEIGLTAAVNVLTGK